MASRLHEWPLHLPWQRATHRPGCDHSGAQSGGRTFRRFGLTTPYRVWNADQLCGAGLVPAGTKLEPRATIGVLPAPELPNSSENECSESSQFWRSEPPRPRIYFTLGSNLPKEIHVPISIRSGHYRTFHRLKPNESYLEFEGSIC